MSGRLILILTLAATGLHAQEDGPFPPHKVIGNIYYVGSKELASFLITTPQGHILINSSYERTVPLIEASVEKLGFHFRDINFLLDSHAHGDHVAGNPLVKRMTGATVMVMQGDEKSVPGSIDRVLKNGDQVKLGGVVLTARLTPGHTKGATTWITKVNDGGKAYNVVIVSSVSVNPGYQLVNNKKYPEIADDYRRAFEVLRSLPCDVFLAPHGKQYGLAEKYERMGKGANPFIDTQGYKAYLDNGEKLFQGKLEEQKR